MLLSSHIQTPILFNCIKHHLHFAKQYTSTVIHQPGGIQLFKDASQHIGSSLIDLYIGDLTPENITQIVISWLHRENVYSDDTYMKWLHHEGKRYRIITLEDGSNWTLLLGNHEDRYVHIHPSRYADQTVRIHANAYKSALATYALLQLNPQVGPGLEVINKARRELLDLQPVKELSTSKGIGKALVLLSKANSPTSSSPG